MPVNKERNEGFMSHRTKKVIASGIAILLVLALVISFVATLRIYAYAAEANSNSVSSLRSEISGIQSERDSLKKQLESLSNKKSQLLENKSLLEKEAELNKIEISKQEELIKELDASIAQKTDELAQAELDESEQYETFKQRVRVMYEHGNLNYLELLLSSESFAEMISRLEIVSTIIEHDNKIMDELSETRQKISDTKLELESERQEQSELKTALLKNRDNIEAQIAKSEELSAQIKNDEETVKAIYDEMEKEEARLQKELQEQLAELEKNRKNNTYVGGTMSWPLPGYTYISSPFGMRLHPTLKVYKLHTGVDIPAPKGTNILAANDGTVLTATYSKAWGNYVVISHGGGVVTLYAHMTNIKVSKGASITKGQVIGTVGTTGYSTGNHLHFEIQRNGVSEDPFEKEFSK